MSSSMPRPPATKSISTAGKMTWSSPSKTTVTASIPARFPSRDTGGSTTSANAPKPSAPRFPGGRPVSPREPASNWPCHCPPPGKEP